MGLLFTYKPPFPKGILLKRDLVKIFADSFVPSSNKFRNTLLTIVFLLLGIAAGYLLYLKFR